jgi:hypothetical protein
MAGEREIVGGNAPEAAHKGGGEKRRQNPNPQSRANLCQETNGLAF